MKRIAPIRWAALGVLFVLLGCGGSGGGGDPCLLLGPAPTVSSAPTQVLLEVRIVEVDTTFAADVGLSFPFTAQLRTVSPAFLGARHDGVEAVIVDAGLAGGAEDTQIVVPGGSPGGRFVPVFRPNALMPQALDDMTVWPGLPGRSCVEFTELAGEFQGNRIVPPGLSLSDTPGLFVSDLAFNLLDESAADLLIDVIELDADNIVIESPRLALHEGQFGLVMVRDVELDTDDLEDRFRIALADFDPTLESVETGIALTVAPILEPNGDVQIELRPQVSAVGFPNGPVVDDGSDTGLIELPAVAFRQARTSVFVQDGETVVIGGVRLNGNDPVVPGVPLLGNVPVLGPLSAHGSQFDDTRALMVLVTPRLVAAP